jgi:hypothetical protein
MATDVVCVSSYIHDLARSATPHATCMCYSHLSIFILYFWAGIENIESYMSNVLNKVFWLMIYNFQSISSEVPLTFYVSKVIHYGRSQLKADGAVLFFFSYLYDASIVLCFLLFIFYLDQCIHSVNMECLYFVQASYRHGTSL